AVCLVSSNFLPAERNSPSASNAWVAWAFCSEVRVLCTPHQVNETRQAAMVLRSRSAGVTMGSRCGSATAGHQGDRARLAWDLLKRMYAILRWLPLLGGYRGFRGQVWGCGRIPCGELETVIECGRGIRVIHKIRFTAGFGISADGADRFLMTWWT